LPKLSLCPHPQEPDLLPTTATCSLHSTHLWECVQQRLGEQAVLGLNKAEPTEAEPRGSATLPLTSSAFHILHAAVFPATQKQMKRAEEK